MPAPRRLPAKPAPVQRAPVRKDAPVDMSKVRLKIEYIDINDIVPYEWNARDNANAVAAVANSIKTFGFLVPVVIDANGVLGAGHTRVEAGKTLGMLDVPAVRAEHLTKEQMDAFRIIDNKVSEIADWDFALLAAEIEKLDGAFNFTDYGFGQGELDCLSSMVNDDCLNTAGLGAQGQEEQREQRNVLRSPTRARIVVGEFVLWVTADEYRVWSNGLRALHNFDNELAEADIKQRLGFAP